ncbi:hypothetical protein CCR75_008163 [Bremia lactucae]|uniref:Uncharacterized protein n=1 Tax=Bremia lactucae TaxID=4779 RepID=A0A976FH92_BRELC|nr:hypothetical protein CCR75_008163 [Bremia lactucae]
MAKTSSFVPDQIHVSSSQQRELTEMADAIIAETLHVYEHFVAHDRVLPLHAWKLTKSRENVRVYRARKLSTASKTHEIRRPRTSIRVRT